MARIVNQASRFGGGDFAKKSPKFTQRVISLSIVLMMVQASNSIADPLIKTIPAQSFNIPAGDLTRALSEYSANAGVLFSFDSELTHNKTTQGLKGKYSINEGFDNLLKGTGLEIINNNKGELELRKAPPIKVSENNLPIDVELQQVQVRAKRFYEIGPLPGLGLTKEQIPGNVQSITAEEIKQSHSLSITDLMNKKLQSVTVNDYQGNPFQMDVQYRGFTAGPQIGTPQGLSVFFDGIRVNEPFGDVVNWDMIPMNALASVDVFPGSNPIFGLNTLGGAFTVKTKDGFNHDTANVEVLTGSFGRRQLQLEGGWNNGTVALFGAGNFFLEDGWRESSPSKVNQFFGKASYRGDKLDLNFSSLIVGTDLTGNGLLPSEEYARNRNGVFTSPDTTENRLQQFQLSSNYFVNDNFTITGQVYRRNSKRKQIGADVFTDYDQESLARRRLAPGEQYTCLLDSTNQYGLPDYYVLTIENLVDGQSEIFGDPFFLDSLGNGFVGNPALLPASAFNQVLPDEVARNFQARFKQDANFQQSLVIDQGGLNDLTPEPGPVTSFSFGEASYSSNFGLGTFRNGLPNSVLGTVSLGDFYYYTNDGNVPRKNYVFFITPKNNDNCTATQATNASQGGEGGGPALTYIDPNGSGLPTTIDGALFNQRGVVEGTPTAVITDNQIDQMVNGASIQFNWNFEQHKFMVGASIDAADATYSNSQQLGFLDASRNAFLAPDLAHPQFAGADVALANNDFSGTNTTKSIYFSETWTPTKQWNFSASARYNETQTKNKVATRSGFGVFGVGDLVAYPDDFAICPNGDCAGVSTGYKTPDLSNVLDPAETEKFSYYSFNPSLGGTWQARENLNIFANWAKGTRTPSVIELGCALDKSSGTTTSDGQGGTVFIPKSVLENRQCSLPTTLSGDPFLPQIRATTYDIGMRGTLPGLLVVDDLQWNLGAYQTDLKDDIYFVAVANGAGFFDSIGNTRRRGVEAGISGRVGKANFSLNYGLTDATFQDDFLLFSRDNSSARLINSFGTGVINVKPGSRMPGVPLHNLNANVSYEITPKWQIGLSAVMHSESFVRGNENNQHQKGVPRVVPINIPDPANPGGFLPSTLTLPPTNNPGKLPGYATFNFQTSYKFNSEWTATMLVNNVLDKEFFSAGRLGRNPFSPSINGAIGPGGYNHNSNDWLSTNFIAPSAPRGIWFSLNWQFDPNKK